MTSARRDLVLACMTTVVMLAALVAMSRVFVTGEWVQPAVMAALLAGATAAGARRVGLGALGALLTTLVTFLVFAYVVHLPAGPLIPGREQLAQMGELFRAGLLALRDQPAPAETLPELVFLVSSATWAVAFVVHELAVRLHRPGAALIPATALWVVPLSMPQPLPAGPRTAIPFLLAAALLLLLESDADLAGWARERIAPRITVAGTGLAIVAVAFGAFAPGLLPGYQKPPLLDLGTGSDPRGYQPIVDIGDRPAARPSPPTSPSCTRATRSCRSRPRSRTPPPRWSTSRCSTSRTSTSPSPTSRSRSTATRRARWCGRAWAAS